MRTLSLALKICRQLMAAGGRGAVFFKDVTTGKEASHPCSCKQPWWNSLHNQDEKQGCGGHPGGRWFIGKRMVSGRRARGSWRMK